MPAEKRSISAPQELFARADARQAELQYSKFSDYIQALIVRDVQMGGDHIRHSTKSSAAVAAAPVLPAAKSKARIISEVRRIANDK